MLDLLEPEDPTPRFLQVAAEGVADFSPEVDIVVFEAVDSHGRGLPVHGAGVVDRQQQRKF